MSRCLEKWDKTGIPRQALQDLSANPGKSVNPVLKRDKECLGQTRHRTPVHVHRNEYSFRRPETSGGIAESLLLGKQKPGENRPAL